MSCHLNSRQTRRKFGFFASTGYILVSTLAVLCRLKVLLGFGALVLPGTNPLRVI
jgi:hypothetical protein